MKKTILLLLLLVVAVTGSFAVEKFKKNLWEGDPIVSKKGVKNTNIPATLKIAMDELYIVSVAKEDCTKNNNPEACFITGHYFLTQPSLQDSALKFLTKACDLENKTACVMKGMMYLDGISVKKDIDNAGFYFKNNCFPGELVEGCVFFGSFYQIKNKYFKSSKIFNEICFSEKTNSAYKGVACQSLGFNYIKGLGVRHNTKKAKKLFGLACDHGDSQGCYNYKLLNE
mgnify:FL=1|jgi:TPR repeat protein